MKKPLPLRHKKKFFSRGEAQGPTLPPPPHAGAPVFNTKNKHSGENAPIPLNIVPSNTTSITFVYRMNIFANFFLTKLQQNILQNAPNCTIFLNFLWGACSRTPITKAWRFAPCIYPHFRKLD